MSNVFAEFLVNQGLYDKIEITEDNINDLCDLIDGKEKINIYCKECGQMRVYGMNSMITLMKRDISEKASFGSSLAESLRSHEIYQKIRAIR